MNSDNHTGAKGGELELKWTSENAAIDTVTSKRGRKENY